MPDKLTDNEIVKALEYCKVDDCDKCPNTYGNCYSNLAGYALDLINRLQAENTELLGKIEDLEANRVELIENIEQLESVITQIKTEAYKEFVEKTNNIIESLIEQYSIKDFEEFKAICQVLRGLKNDTNNLLNELVGDK